MKKIYILSMFSFLLSIYSCAPSIYTNIHKSYNPTSPDSIDVFALGEQIPNSAEIMGEFAIRDNGTSRKFTYSEAVDMAKNETAKIGGNALSIMKEVKPSVWGSNCYQIGGYMLNLTDYKIDNSKENPFARAEEIRKKRLKEYYPPKNTIYGNIGIGFVNSKFVGWPSGSEPKRGIDLQIGYNRIFSNCLGFGINYTYYTKKYEALGYQGRFSMNYIGPEFIAMGRLSKRILLGSSIGFGYICVTDKLANSVIGQPSAKYNIFGSSFQVMFDVQISKGFGIGFRGGILGGTKEINIEENTKLGINRWSLGIGPRFYF